MKFSIFFGAVLPLFAQGSANASLSGRYWVRQVLMVSPASGNITQAQSFSGAATFDGNGRFTFTGQSGAQTAAPAALTGSGTYTVGSDGLVTLSNPLRGTATMNGRLSELGLIASTTEAGGGVYDLLIAVPAPTGGVSNASLNGPWWVAGVDYLNGTLGLARAAFFRLTASGGSFGDVTVTGQAANLGIRPVVQTVAGASYSLTGDGGGTANFPLPAGTMPAQRLLSGPKTLSVSRDGNLLLMGSTAGGGHDLFVGIRAAAGGVTNGTWMDLYWTAGIKLDSGRLNCHAGAANSTGAGVLLLSRRVRAPEGVVDFSGVNRYTLQGDGSGRVELNGAAIGAGGNAFLGSGVSLADANNYELYVGLRATAVRPGSAVFLHPHGAVNAASFAPAGNPVSPGEFVTLFGSGLAGATATAGSLPFPASLGGVQVLVNNRPAPVYLASPGQISFLVPWATEIGEAGIVAVNNGVRSNEIRLRVARTSPGVFSVPPIGSGPGAILKTNFTLVSAANPARRGETVLIFLTGLGAVAPAVPDGAAAPATPLSLVTGAVNVYIGGVPAPVSFQGLAPGLAGLYQLNVVVPARAPGGASVPVGIETPDAFHDQVDIAIAP